MPFFSKSRKKLTKDLFRAIRDHKEVNMKRALEEGADPAAYFNLESVYGGYHYAYPLQYAVERGYSSFIQQLFEAIPEALKSKIVWESLKTAVDYKNTKAIGMLLDLAPDTKIFVTNYGRTLLHYAAARGQGEVVEILVAKGLDPAAKDENMNTAAELADKEYPNIAAYIRSAMTQTAKAPPSVPSAWVLMAPDEVAHTSENAVVGYRLTRIFNFTAQTYTQIAQNVDTKAETQALRFFSEIEDDTILKTAREELARLGGNTGFAVHEIRKPLVKSQNKSGPTP